jgi:MFS transporter, PHS family, inorganic phosphate transporter
MDEILPPATPQLGRSRTEGGNNAFHNFYNDYSHIPDPNLRRRLALSEIDTVPFGLYRSCPFHVGGLL